MNIVITGAGGVLCSAFSRALAADGHKIALLDLNLEAAEREAEGIRKAGGEAIAVQANVLDKESLKKAHDVVLEEFGPCEVLINGAGGNNPKGTTTSEYFSKEDMLDENARSFFDLDQDGVSFVFNLNFLGTLLTTQAFATAGNRRLHCEYLLDERVYATDEDPGVQRCQGSGLELHAVAGGTLCKLQHPRERHCAGLLCNESEPHLAL